MTEPTIKTWKRRALAAEAALESVRAMRRIDTECEMDAARENTAMRVALNEIQGVLRWANDYVSLAPGQPGNTKAPCAK